MKPLFIQLKDKMEMGYNTNFQVDSFTQAWLKEMCELVEDLFQKNSDVKCPHCRKRIDMETKGLEKEFRDLQAKEFFEYRLGKK